MRIALVAILFSLPAGALGAQPAPADTIALSWSMTVDQLEAPPTATAFVVACPSPDGSEGNVWGTGTYTADSSICRAAVHAGVLGRDGGGAFVVEIVEGLPSYTATTSNGITSISYPAWPSSFRFPGAPAATSPAVAEYDYDGDWYTTARQVQAPVGARVRFECSGGGQGGNVWGTDVYTDDSSICEAAVHAGVIDRAAGGGVRFEVLGPQTSFTGTERHGATSMRYPAWPGSFRFVADETAPDSAP
ncbi:hypothetical protein BH20GEM1_BH20GEM1_06130 [soil metagenome]